MAVTLTTDSSSDKKIWIILGLLLLLGLAVWFGIYQYNRAASQAGNLVALTDSVHHWKDKYGDIEASTSILISDKSLIQAKLDSVVARQGTSPDKITGITTVGSGGTEVLKPIPRVESGWDTSSSVYKLATKLGTITDTGTYALTAADTVEWMKNGWYKEYANRWDTAKVYWDSVQLVIKDSLTLVERTKIEGGFFNRKYVPYIDAYHENPALRDNTITAWEVSVPDKKWSIGPAALVFPRVSSSGINLGWGIGIGITRDLIRF